MTATPNVELSAFTFQKPLKKSIGVFGVVLLAMLAGVSWDFLDA
jgi:hypothetical protein